MIAMIPSETRKACRFIPAPFVLSLERFLVVKRSASPCVRVIQMARALFVCLHNAGRSQISEALFLRAAAGRHEARSAGTTPGDRVHPEVIEAMSELGIDLGDRRPHRLSREDAEWADVVV